MSGRSSATLRLTNLALLTTVALIIFVIEANLPPLTSIPGIKMGLANIVTLSVFYLFSQKDALMVLLVRVILGAFASGQIMTLPYSLSGGLLCFCVCALLLPLFPLKRLWLLSVIGAIFHNIGQIIVAVVLTGTPEIIWYLPVLLISGTISGFFTGYAAQSLLIHMDLLKIKKQ